MELRDGVNTGLVWPASSCALGRDPTVATCCCSAGPSPTWRGTASPTRRRPRRAARRRQDGAPRRVPVRHAAHPAAAACRSRPRRRSCSPACRSARARSTCRPGMAAALEQTRRTSRGIPALGIWAQVPHYVSSMSYPAATVALLDGLRDGDRRRTSTPPTCGARPTLQRGASTQLVAGNDEHRAMLAPARAALRRRRSRRVGRRPAADDTRPAAPRSADRAAIRRRARGRGRALPPRPGQGWRGRSTTAAGDAIGSYGCHHEGRRRHPNQSRQGRPAGGRSSRRRATRAVGPPRPATTRSCRCVLAAEHTDGPRARHVDRRRVRPQPDDARQPGVGPADVLARAGSSSASAARSSRTSRSASRWSGATRRRACGRWSWPSGPSGTPG